MLSNSRVMVRFKAKGSCDMILYSSHLTTLNKNKDNERAVNIYT